MQSYPLFYVIWCDYHRQIGPSFFDELAIETAFTFRIVEIYCTRLCKAHIQSCVKSIQFVWQRRKTADLGVRILLTAHDCIYKVFSSSETGFDIILDGRFYVVVDPSVQNSCRSIR